jgi:hypothetical protein
MSLLMRPYAAVGNTLGRAPERPVNSGQGRLEGTIPPTCRPYAGQDVVLCLAGVLDFPAWQGLCRTPAPGPDTEAGWSVARGAVRAGGGA